MGTFRAKPCHFRQPGNVFAAAFVAGSDCIVFFRFIHIDECVTESSFILFRESGECVQVLVTCFEQSLASRL